MNDLLLGMDEAGRGPVLGPLVIGGLEVSKDTLDILERIHVRDSKELRISQIFKLYEQLKEIKGRIFVKIIPATKLNILMGEMTLNQIEFRYFSEIISESKAETIFVDSFFPDAKKLYYLFKSSYQEREFVVEHKADSKYVIVGGASIIAKYHREKEMDKIRNKYSKYGDIGSGYPADEKTISFLKQYYKEKGCFPDESRIRWSTLENIRGKIKQKRLF